MQVNETHSFSLRCALESVALEEGVVLADNAGVALGATRVFSPEVRFIRHDVTGLVGCKWVEIPLVGHDGEISGVLCRIASESDVVPTCRREGTGTVKDTAQFVVHDINNLFAVIDSGLRLLECRDDVAFREAIVCKMREAITRGALLSRQLLDTERVHPSSSDGFVEGNRFAAMSATLDRALRPDIVVRTEIAPDLADFNADPEELYFALLNLCRNSADAMPNGGVITVAARNIETFKSAIGGAVEIVVADDGEGMSEEVLSQALKPYFTTKAPGSGSGLGLPQVQRFIDGRGGAVAIESERDCGTVVRLLLPRVYTADVRRGAVAAKIAYVPTPDGGVFHLVDSAKDASTP